MFAHGQIETIELCLNNVLLEARRASRHSFDFCNVRVTEPLHWVKHPPESLIKKFVEFCILKIICMMMEIICEFVGKIGVNQALNEGLNFGFDYGTFSEEYYRCEERNRNSCVPWYPNNFLENVQCCLIKFVISRFAEQIALGVTWIQENWSTSGYLSCIV